MLNICPSAGGVFGGEAVEAFKGGTKEIEELDHRGYLIACSYHLLPS